jgi:nucleotide-binding universal stress UspA family protein
MFRRILIAIDDSPPAQRAVRAAVRLAEQLGGQLAAVHVVDSERATAPELAVINEGLLAELRQRGHEILEDAYRQIPPQIKVERYQVVGDPGECILDLAREWAADLIVIGSDSRGRLAHFLLGSTADAVIRRASCPVIAVRAGAALGEGSNDPPAIGAADHAVVSTAVSAAV